MLLQSPAPGTTLRRFAGDALRLTLRVPEGRRGRAFVRTNAADAAAGRRERLAADAENRPPLATDWRDLPMEDLGDGLHALSLPLPDPGVFSAKSLFVPEGSSEPLWPEGGDIRVKVAPSSTRSRNSIYTAFLRCFPPAAPAPHDPSPLLPSGTFRALARRLDTICGEMGFGIVQLLPIHPAPTVFGRMGAYGSPFAGLDFLAVDPAYAEFDPAVPPIGQFRELVDAVHAHGARLFLDLPANHAGWASTLLANHPEWFRRESDGRFHSPGAWGIVWEDLVELDYSRPGLREFMADVFLHWCEEGVDGFRCDAGYMIPVPVWRHIVDRVRSRFPETVFLLEGLGGSIDATRALLSDAGLDWAYSELFQTGDRSAFESYLPGAQALSDSLGPLVHFAETHDNNRLAARSPAYARMRTALSALLSPEGAFGITCGVEWFATEKIGVHDATDLRWGNPENQVAAIGRLNALLATHPAFGPGSTLRMVQSGPGNSLAVLRTPPESNEVQKSESQKVKKSKSPKTQESEVQRKTENQKPETILSPSLLILVNLDPDRPQPVQWPAAALDAAAPIDLLTGATVSPTSATGGLRHLDLAPAQVLCLAPIPFSGNGPTKTENREPQTANRKRQTANGKPENGNCKLSSSTLRLPADCRRIVPVPPGHALRILSPDPLRGWTEGGIARDSHPLPDGTHELSLAPLPAVDASTPIALHLLPGIAAPDSGDTHPVGRIPPLSLLALPPAPPPVRMAFPASELRNDPERVCLLTNGRGAMSHVRVAWPLLASRYDALLAANLDPAVPCDRWMLLARCRLWVRYHGYSQPLDASTLESFETDGATARWTFRPPLGNGFAPAVLVSLSLLPNRNKIHLSFSLSNPQTANRKPRTPNRELQTANCELQTANCELQTANCEPQTEAAPAQDLLLIVRPDVDSRSFHSLTKAYAGPEHAWPTACTTHPAGVSFRPQGLPGLELAASTGSFVFEPEWAYAVPLPHDAQRGQDASCDLFSPGYFRLPLASPATLVAGATIDGEFAVRSSQSPVSRKRPAAAALPAALLFPDALLSSMRSFLVARDDVATVIAGYPWFLDWGRDTFIFLRGMVAASWNRESIAIIRAFARFERDGTLPNMIRGSDDSNRDTSDAPLWFATAVQDLCERNGDDVLDTDCSGRSLLDVLVGIASGYRRGTPNGIAMDPESGLVFSPPHFTWMDTNFPAGTPREGYPVEIQALWIRFLRFLGRVRPREGWDSLADLAAASVRRLFWLPANGFFSDCLHARPGTPAARAVPDDHLRPNQLFLATLGVLDPAQPKDRDRMSSLLDACARLLVPGAIRTLDDAPVATPLPIDRDGRRLNDPLRPYWGHYEGDEDTRRKPAYHNGTAWTWPFPSYAEALVRLRGSSAVPEARSLLASAVPLLEHGAIGHLPEILDGDAPHAQRGCDAQAWGASEFYRVWSLLSTPSPIQP